MKLLEQKEMVWSQKPIGQRKDSVFSKEKRTEDGASNCVALNIQQQNLESVFPSSQVEKRCTSAFFTGNGSFHIYTSEELWKLGCRGKIYIDCKAVARFLILNMHRAE